MEATTVAALLAGGIVGYAVGQDGRLKAVSQSEINTLLRDSKPEFLKKVDIDTSIARDGVVGSGEYPIAGSFILVLNPSTPTTTVNIKLNEPEWPALPLTSLRRIVGPFYRFFIKNTAGSGMLNLIIARGYQFQLFEGEVNVVGTNLNSLGDVKVPSPTDNDLLKWNSTTEKWEDEALLAAELPDHASRHQDLGADEISLTDLSGDPADTINESLLTTRGDILFRGTSIAERLPKGTSGQFLKQGANDPEWADAPAVPSSVSIPSRSIDTVYQNTTGGTIIVSVVIRVDGATNERAVIKIGSSSPPGTPVGQARHQGGGYSEHTHTFLVPNNWYYEVVTLNSSPSVSNWTEYS